MEFPHSERTNWISKLILIGLDPSSIVNNSLFFVRLVSFVIPVQRHSLQVAHSTLPGQHCPGVPGVGTKDFVSHNEDTDASAATKPQVDATVLLQTGVDCHETAHQLVFDLSRVHNPLVDLGLIKRVLDVLFNDHAQTILNVLGHIFSIHAVAICHRKEVRPAVLSQMGQHQVAVLVDFVWVFGRVPRFGGESELGYAVVEFLARLRRLCLGLVLSHICVLRAVHWVCPFVRTAGLLFLI